MPQVLGVLAALAVFVCIFLAWLSFDVGSQSISEKGTDVPVQFLWDIDPGDEEPSLVIALAPIALVILIGSAIARARVLALIGGVLAIIVAALFVIQTGSLLDDNGLDIGAFDALGVAPYVTFVGGIVAVVAGLLPRSD